MLSHAFKSGTRRGDDVRKIEVEAGVPRAHEGNTPGAIRSTSRVFQSYWFQIVTTVKGSPGVEEGSTASGRKKQEAWALGSVSGLAGYLSSPCSALTTHKDCDIICTHRCEHFQRYFVKTLHKISTL